MSTGQHLQVKHVPGDPKGSGNSHVKAIGDVVGSLRLVLSLAVAPPTRNVSRPFWNAAMNRTLLRVTLLTSLTLCLFTASPL